MNATLKKHLIKSLGQDVRGDGRARLDFRNIEIERGVTATAEGSARVRIGETEVIAGVKMMVDKPFGDRPDEGIVMVGAELLPLSSPEFEVGPPGEWAIEIARVTDRGIRESEAIDTKKLVIESGEKVWLCSVDICTINDAGNILDAGSLATLAALQDARLPALDDDKRPNYKEKTDEQIPMLKTPVAVTVYKIGDHLVVDPSPEEEKCTDARLTITSTEDGRLCSLQKGGEETFTAETVNEMVKIAVDKAKELRSAL